MADQPFFRGENRMDWLIAVMLQTAVDYYGPYEIAQAISPLGEASSQVFPSPGNLYPRIAVVTTQDYVFVVSQSTKNLTQMIGNILGSVATPVPLLPGLLHAYFSAVAIAQYAQCRSAVIAASPSRKVVFIGFSLGGASTQILASMFAILDGITATAGVQFGNPRPGNAAFCASVPSANVSEFGVTGDVVPSLAPVPWSAIGAFTGWIPSPPFVIYSHVTGGRNMSPDGTLSDGFALQTVPQVISNLADGTAKAIHIQSVYAKAIRSQGLPEVLTDGFDGYPKAGETDNIASSLFYFDPPWRWVSPPKTETSLLSGVTNMACVAAIYFRNVQSPPLGFQELYYISTDDVNTVINRFLAAPGASVGSTINRFQIQAGTLIAQRLQFLSKDVEIFAFRASHVGSPKASRVVKFAKGSPGVNGDDASITDSIAYFGFTAGRTAKRQFHFRAIPLTYIDGDNLSNVGISTGAPKIEAWLAALKGAGLAILANNTTIPNGTKIQGCQKATQTDPITLMMAAAPGFTEGQLVTVTGCKGNPLLNGRWLVGLTTPNTNIILKGSQTYSAPADLGGVVRSTDLQAFDCNDFEFNGVVDKKTGRPSYLRRGRQSARIRHR